MDTHKPVIDLGLTLALAVVAASDGPLLLLDGELAVIAASDSFCSAFGVDHDTIAGTLIYDLDGHSWNVPRLRSLLNATISGMAAVKTYELDITIPALGRRRLVLKPQMLDYGVTTERRLLLAIADVTDARLDAQTKASLLRDREVLVREVEHRVANSLQIIASILMQSARKVQSEEVRGHLSDAHQRVMSIAALQHQLAESGTADVALAPYLAQLCESLGASMIHDHDRLTLTARIDKQVVPADVSVSLGLVVTELVINALKHAFPDKQDGHVLVDYATRGSEWTLSVTDDGIGMPELPARAKSGLGTSIVQALARQLHAEIEVSDNAPGTRVSLTHDREAARDAANDAADLLAV
ncbi:MAG: sensor histidine kinase [Polymorphobacter sp.]